MPMKPDEIDSSKLPVAFRGYDRAATDDLLERIALDYRQAARAPEAWAKESEWFKSRIAGSSRARQRCGSRGCNA
jgi:hypothetical protein